MPRTGGLAGVVSTESIKEIGSTVSISIIVSMPSTVVAVSMVTMTGMASTMSAGNATSVVNTPIDMSGARTVSTLTSLNTSLKPGVASGARGDGTANRVASGPRLADVLSGRNRGVSEMPVAGLQSTAPRGRKADKRMVQAWAVGPVPVGLHR